eukprot:g17022.t1
MILFDVTALFTSVDIPLARETMTAILEQEQDPSETTSTDNMLNLCLTTHFTFNGQTYKLINGTPMESPISGLIAKAVMQRLERTAIPLIQPKLRIRYMDDTFVIIKQTKLKETHKRIKFTREEEKNKQLPFLDVMVERRTNRELQTK